MTSLLTASNIAISGRLKPTSIAANAGEMVAVVGPNGSGKTSLLLALAGVEDVGGDVSIDGETLAEAAPNRRSKLVGFLPASRDIAWPITVRDIIRLGGHPDEAQLGGLVEALELTTLLDRRVDHLSTGERARVLVTRVLAMRPRLLLLDEPLSNLDPYWVLRLLELLRSETRAAPRTAFITLHDVRLAERFDRLIAVECGAVAFDGVPSKFLKSKDFEAIFRVEYQSL